jgi:hypothetical protein
MTDNPDPTSTLQNQTLHYKDQLITICKDLTDKTTQTITNCYTDLYKTIETALKNNIMQTIGTKDLYNYDTIPEVKMYKHRNAGHIVESQLAADFIPATPADLIHSLSRSDTSCLCYQNPTYYKGDIKCRYCTKKIIADKFSKFVTNEKLIIWNKFYDPEGNKNSFIDIKYEFITNFGRYLFFRVHGQGSDLFIRGDGGHYITYEELNFWIPTDYIHLIKNMHQSFIGIHALKHIKDHLYDRKLVPLYTQDIVTDNKELKDKYDKYLQDTKQLELDQKKFNLDKQHFLNNEKPYLDLIKDRKEVNELREKLQLIAKNLKLERLKLEKEKEAIQNINLEGFDI